MLITGEDEIKLLELQVMQLTRADPWRLHSDLQENLFDVSIDCLWDLNAVRRDPILCSSERRRSEAEIFSCAGEEEDRDRVVE